MSLLLSNEVDKQAIEPLHADIGVLLQCFLSQANTCLLVEDRPLLVRSCDRDDDLIEDLRGTLDHVDVTFGDRIEGTWNDCPFHSHTLSYQDIGCISKIFERNSFPF